jgi:hypothetical protein
MIQVDVGEENIGDMGRGKLVLIQGLQESRDGRARATFHQSSPLVVGDEKYTDGIGDAMKVKIKCVDGRKGHEVPLMVYIYGLGFVVALDGFISLMC